MASVRSIHRGSAAKAEDNSTENLIEWGFSQLFHPDCKAKLMQKLRYIEGEVSVFQGPWITCEQSMPDAIKDAFETFLLDTKRRGSDPARPCKASALDAEKAILLHLWETEGQRYRDCFRQMALPYDRKKSFKDK